MAKRRSSRSGPNGRLSYRPAPDEGPIPKTLEFVRTQLPGWRDDPKRPKDSSEKQANEKRLNSSLCDFLESRARSDCPMVRFKHEAPQTGARTVDIGVHGTEETTFAGPYGYTIYDPFMVIECKRLPAPSRDREREYVTGTNSASGTATGGIQRFKLGLHGGKVEVAVIVGYVEEKTTKHWYTTINQWITELAAATSPDACVWSKDDKLQQLNRNDAQATSATKSIHQRSPTCRTLSITLHHLWVIMKSE